MSLVSHLLNWMDADVARYWTVAWSAMGVLITVSLLPELPWLLNWKQPPAGRAWRFLTGRMFYIGAVTLTFVAFRWPGWFAHSLANPDESQMIAGAITLQDYPVFWKSVDGTTHGPLSDYVLLIPRLAGLAPDYFSARLMGTGLHLLCLLGIWSAARRWLSDSAARLGLLSAMVQWGTTSSGDFVQYNSEMLPLALIGLAAAAGSRPLVGTPPRYGWIWMFAAGLMLGAVPYAKLQAVPVAGVLAVLLLAACLFHWWRDPIPASRRQPISLATGLLGPSLLVGALLLAYGLGPQFWQAYIRNNLVYASGGSSFWRWVEEGWFPFIKGVTGFTSVFLGHAAIFTSFGLVALFGTARTRWIVLAAWLMLASSFFAVMSPGRPFTHYLQLLVPGAAFLLAAIYQGVKECLAGHFRTPCPAMLRWVPFCLVLLSTVWPVLFWRSAEAMGFNGAFMRHEEPWRKPVSDFILTRAQPSDRLAMWGWQPDVYVETGLPQGTRDAHTQRMIERGPMQDFYRDRYLRDLTRNQPAWFVDAVGPGNFGFTDRSAAGHESFPALAAIIAANYSLMTDVEGYRVYRRKAP